MFAMALLLPLVAVMGSVLPVTNSLGLEPVTGNQLSLNQMPDEWLLAEDEMVPVMDGTQLIMALRNVGEAFAVKFTPPSYPFEITSVIYVPISWVGTNFQTPGDVVFMGTTLSGGPKTTPELGRKSVTPTVYNDIDEFDVSDINVTISSGSFFFVLQATEEPEEQDLPCYPAAWPDHMKPVHHASWGYLTFTHPDSTDPFQAWLSFDNFKSGSTGWPQDMVVGDSIDMLMRVRGNAPGIGEVVLDPDLTDIQVITNIVASGTSFSYSLANPGDVSISLWDALGREVKTLYTGHAEAGSHLLDWDASDLARGTYFVRLDAPGAMRLARVVVID
jgi:hypothetical protein